KEILLSLARQYDGQDRWYLEALGSAMDTDAAVWYDTLKASLGGTNTLPGQWQKPMIDFAWRLHPANSVNDIVSIISDSLLPTEERSLMVTALAFINQTPAANAMLAVAKSNLPNVKEQAAYWLSFRQSNDWYNLLNWSKIKFNGGFERNLARMKVKRGILLDERQSRAQRKWQTEEMAKDSVGGQMLIGLAAENKIPQAILPFVESSFFNNPAQPVRIQAGRYFKRPGNGRIFSIEEILKLKGDAVAGRL